MKQLLLVLTISLLSGSAFSQRCHSNSSMLCEGNTVLHKDTVRTVEGVDDTNRVILAEDSKYYRTFTTIDQVSKTLRCHQDLCRRDSVLSGDTIREVELLDNKGRLVLEENSKYYRTFTRRGKVSKVVNCFGRFCVGDEVLRGNTTREIEAVDDTGRVVLRENSKYYRTFSRSSEISMLKACTRFGAEHRVVRVRPH